MHFYKCSIHTPFNSHVKSIQKQQTGNLSNVLQL